MNTLGRVHTHLQKQTWSTLFQIKLTCKHLKQPKWNRTSWLKRKLQSTLFVYCLFMHAQSVSDRDTEWILTCFLWDYMDGDAVSVTLPTHQLAAMEQFGVWQLLCFTLCFSFLIKHLARSRGMSDLMRSLLCFGTFTACKNTTQQEKKRAREKCAALRGCGVDMFQWELSRLDHRSWVVSLNS